MVVLGGDVRTLAGLAFAFGWRPDDAPETTVCGSDPPLRRLCPRQTALDSRRPHRGTQLVAKTAKTDRQAKIDQIRNEAKGAERRRGFVIVGVCVVIALLIVGSAWWVSGRPLEPQWFAERKFQKLNLDEIGASTAACQKVETKPAGSSEHVPTDTPVSYKDSPPAFGAHWNEAGVAPAPIERHLYAEDDRPALESLVRNLEHGYTILWYDDTIAGDDEAVSQLDAIAGKFTDDQNFRNSSSAPWTSDDGDAFPDDQHVAITHWSAGGARRRGGIGRSGCGGTAPTWRRGALEDFVLRAPYTDSPEPAPPDRAGSGRCRTGRPAGAGSTHLLDVLRTAPAGHQQGVQGVHDHDVVRPHDRITGRCRPRPSRAVHPRTQPPSPRTVRWPRSASSRCDSESESPMSSAMAAGTAATRLASAAGSATAASPARSAAGSAQVLEQGSSRRSGAAGRRSRGATTRGGRAALGRTTNMPAFHQYLPRGENCSATSAAGSAQAGDRMGS